MTELEKLHIAVSAEEKTASPISLLGKGFRKAVGAGRKVKNTASDFIDGARMKPITQKQRDLASYQGHIQIPKAGLLGNQLRHQPFSTVGRGVDSFVRSRPMLAAGATGTAGILGGAQMYRNHVKNRIQNMSAQQRLMAALAALFNPKALSDRF